MSELQFMHQVLLLMLALSATTGSASAADTLDYELEVSGMVCAYCAYNVFRQLRRLDDVDPKSIDVDLAEGKVRFRSQGPLDETIIVESITAAGFELESVAESPAVPSSVPLHAEEPLLVRLELRADAVADGNYDGLLEALGTLTVRRAARLRVAGPAASEMVTLRPILMGNKPAIDVEFAAGPRPGQTILIEVVGK